MKWSYRLLRVSGIDIRVHATFFIIVLLGALDARQHFGPAGLWFGALLVCAIFLCVTLHELGHSLVAQRFGVSVKQIVLLPIGGVAQLGSEPKTPWHELLIAIAGPLVNVLIAGVLFLSLQPSWATLYDPLIGGDLPSPRAFATWLLVSNVWLAAFNMLPALPMDGGRVLRALLSMFLGKPRATRIAAGLGQLLAVGLIALAFTSGPVTLALIGMFVFLGAAQERTMQQTTGVLSELRAGEVCDPDASALSPGDHLGTVLDQLLRSPQSAFVVLHGHDLIGVVTREDVLHAAPTVGPAVPISRIMRRDCRVVSAELGLDQVRAMLGEARSPVVVMGPEGVLGVLSLEDIARVAAVMQELARRGLRRPIPSPAPET
ncbi:MAG TPA: site-2 protease family protein [Polyangiaceae bacterium]|nr:site-2 protease family protein [Polyangiaceae bacterium]